MKYLLILTVGVCLLLTAVPVMADQAADEAAIRKAIEKLVATWNAHDAKGHVALLAETNVPWEYGGKGTKEGQEKYYTEFFTKQKEVKGKIAKEIGIVFVTPDVAIYKSYAGSTGMVDDNGKAMPPLNVIGAWLMVKKDRNWLLAAFFARPMEE